MFSAVGWAVCIPSIAVAAAFAWSETIKAWADGPHSALEDVFDLPWGVAACSLMLIGTLWLLVFAVVSVKRKSFGGPRGLAPVAVYAVAWSVVLIPHRVWEPLFVEREALGAHAAAFLIDAADRGDLATIDALLGHGVPVNAADTTYGTTALHVAAYRGRAAVVNLLLERGADPNALAGAGNSPLHSARESGSVDTAELIEKHGGRDIPPKCRNIAPVLVASDELRIWYGVRREAVNAFLAGDLAGLEELGVRYAEGATTPAGTPMLWLYHDGLSRRLFAPECGIDKPWSEYEAKTLLWSTQYPKSPRAIVSHASALLGHALAIRGTGYARDVKEENWAPFRRYVALTREYLEAHAAIGKRDPEWYSTMMAVAVDQGWPHDDFMKLYDEAATAFPDYVGIYFEALTYFAPKWYGSWREMDEVIRDGAKRSSAKMGYAMYANLYWWLSDKNEFNELFVDTPAKWDRLKIGFEDVVQRHPDAWNINNYARFACKSGDREKTRDLIERIGQKPLRDAWGGLGLFHRCKQWAEGHGRNYYGPG